MEGKQRPKKKGASAGRPLRSAGATQKQGEVHALRRHAFQKIADLAFNSVNTKGKTKMSTINVRVLKRTRQQGAPSWPNACWTPNSLH